MYHSTLTGRVANSEALSPTRPSSSVVGSGTVALPSLLLRVPPARVEPLAGGPSLAGKFDEFGAQLRTSRSVFPWRWNPMAIMIVFAIESAR